MSTDTVRVRHRAAEGSLAIHDLTVGEARGTRRPVVARGPRDHRQRPVLAAGRRRGRPPPRTGAVRFLAPDLRGRGGSRRVPGPVRPRRPRRRPHLDRLGLRRRAACSSVTPWARSSPLWPRPPTRSASRVPSSSTADSPSRAPADLDIDAALTAVIGPAMDRLRCGSPTPRTTSTSGPRTRLSGRPCAVPGGEAVRQYIMHDLVQDEAAGGQWRSSCVLEAVRADGADVLADPQTHGAVRRARRARRPDRARMGAAGTARRAPGPLRRAAACRPRASRMRWRSPPVDANHYDVILGRARHRGGRRRDRAHLGRSRLIRTRSRRSVRREQSRRRRASCSSRASSGCCQAGPSSAPIRSSRCDTVLTWTCRLAAACRGLAPAAKYASRVPTRSVPRRSS